MSTCQLLWVLDCFQSQLVETRCPLSSELMYREVGDMVDTHDAIFNAMTKIPEHMRGRETPAHLLLESTLLALLDNDFSNLRTKEGTHWISLCRAISEFGRREVRLDGEYITNVKYLHLQTDISTVPRPENAALDDHPWTGRGER